MAAPQTLETVQETETAVRETLLTVQQTLDAIPQPEYIPPENQNTIQETRDAIQRTEAIIRQTIGTIGVTQDILEHPRGPLPQSEDAILPAPIAAPEAVNHEPRIQVTRRSDRSNRTAVLQFVTRRFRKQFQKSQEPYPGGSPTLTPKKSIRKKCSVSERTVDDINIYDVCRIAETKKPCKKRIYYFCGGGWQNPPASQHWLLCAKLARKLDSTTVSIISAPLAPNTPAPKAFPLLYTLYRTLMQSAQDEGVEVILAGDSSGGNIALSLAVEALLRDEVAASGDDAHTPKQPSALMLISPSVDLTRSNPDIENVQALDPLLTPDFIRATAQTWTGEWNEKDSRVSPLFGNILLFKKYGVKVHGVTGSYDILTPDALRFRKKLEQEGVEGSWLEWDKQIHCFPLTFSYHFPEGKEAVRWMVEVLKGE